MHKTGYLSILKEFNDGLDLSPPPTKLKNKTGVSSTMDTDVIDSGTSLYIYIYVYIYHITATAKPELVP